MFIEDLIGMVRLWHLWVLKGWISM